MNNTLISPEDLSAAHFPASLDVCLNNGRPYVQGTQMIARAAEWMQQVTGRTDVRLTAAAFRSITDKGVTIHAISRPEQAKGAFGSVHFSIMDTDYELGFFETETRAPDAVIPEPCSYHHQAGHAGAREQIFEIGEIADLEGAIVAVVQCLKTMSAGMAEDVHDIWFTGLRGARIAHDVKIPAAKLTLTRVRMMGRSPAWQSLNKVEIDGADMPSMLMTFAFKSNSFSPEG